MKLKEDFFARKSEEVAPELIGMALIRRLDDDIASAIITETESYNGRDSRDTAGILYAPGKVYIMPFMWHSLLNISTEAKDVPSCVLIRGVCSKGQAYGPAKLTREFKIDRSLDGKSIESNELWVDTLKEYLSCEPVKSHSTCTGRYRLKKI